MQPECRCRQVASQRIILVKRFEDALDPPYMRRVQLASIVAEKEPPQARPLRSAGDEKVTRSGSSSLEEAGAPAGIALGTGSGELGSRWFFGNAPPDRRKRGLATAFRGRPTTHCATTCTSRDSPCPLLIHPQQAEAEDIPALVRRFVAARRYPAGALPRPDCTTPKHPGRPEARTFGIRYRTAWMLATAELHHSQTIPSMSCRPHPFRTS